MFLNPSTLTLIGSVMDHHPIAKPVRFAAVSEDEKSKCVEAGCPFQLQCELSDPSGTVCWYKDGKELLPEMGLDAHSDGTVRRLAVLSAEMCHAGLYSCKTSDDSVHFTVEIKGDLWLFKILVHTSNLCTLAVHLQLTCGSFSCCLLSHSAAVDDYGSYVCISTCGHLKRKLLLVLHYLI